VHARFDDSATALGRATDAFQSTLPTLRSLNPVNLEAAASALARAMSATETRQVAATSAIEAAATALRELAQSLQPRADAYPASDSAARSHAGTD
jgi:hypothetical protein